MFAQKDKNISNYTDSTYGLTLQKSAKTRKIGIKNYCCRKNPNEFKPKFIHWRNSITSKIKFNNYDKNNLQDYDIKIKEAGTSEKVLPN